MPPNVNVSPALSPLIVTVLLSSSAVTVIVPLVDFITLSVWAVVTSMPSSKVTVPSISVATVPLAAAAIFNAPCALNGKPFIV